MPLGGSGGRAVRASDPVESKSKVVARDPGQNLNSDLKERLHIMNLASMERRLCRIRQLGIPWLLLAMPVAASTVRIYVTNHAGTTISVVDPVTNKVVQEIKDIEVPEAVHFSRTVAAPILRKARKTSSPCWIKSLEKKSKGCPSAVMQTIWRLPGMESGF